MSVEGISTSDLMSLYGENSSYDTSVGDLGYDDFLTLLVAELENQNPLEPLQSSEFTSQLAQFSTVEQLFGMNDVLSNIQDAISAQGEQDFLSLIGKTLKADDNTVLVEDGEVLSGYYSLEDRGDVTVNIYDEEGWLIRTLYIKDQAPGEHSIDWDGLDNGHAAVEDGTYSFKVTAKNKNRASVEVNTYVTGEVTGITYEHGDPYLVLGNRLISPNHTIVEVNKTMQEGS